jgi:hypothetical protein
MVIACSVVAIAMIIYSCKYNDFFIGTMALSFLGIAVITPLFVKPNQ